MQMGRTYVYLHVYLRVLACGCVYLRVLVLNLKLLKPA